MREIAVACGIYAFRIKTRFDNNGDFVETLGASQLDDEVRSETLVF